MSVTITGLSDQLLIYGICGLLVVCVLIAAFCACFYFRRQSFQAKQNNVNVVTVNQQHLGLAVGAVPSSSQEMTFPEGFLPNNSNNFSSVVEPGTFMNNVNLNLNQASIINNMDNHQLDYLANQFPFQVPVPVSFTFPDEQFVAFPLPQIPKSVRRFNGVVDDEPGGVKVEALYVVEDEGDSD
jgi:hypothetical protein